MTTDELKALLAETTPGPWRYQRQNSHDPQVTSDFGGIADVGGYVEPCPANKHDIANARLIALAPVLAAEVIALREREARLVGALAVATYACRVVDEAVREGHQSLPALVNHFLQAVEPARAALAEIEKEAGE